MTNKENREKCGAELKRKFSVRSKRDTWDGEPAYEDHGYIHKCELEPGHKGNHREYWNRTRPVFIEWKGDDRPKCQECGKRLSHLSKCSKCGKAKCKNCMCPRYPDESNHDYFFRSLKSLLICEKCLREQEKKEEKNEKEKNA